MSYGPGTGPIFEIETEIPSSPAAGTIQTVRNPWTGAMLYCKS